MGNDSATTTQIPLDAFKKIDRLWYNDADVVFCAGKSKFRVHRGILSAQSTIFRDMFSLPQGEGEVGTHKDKPFTVITLPDDEKDVYYFFLAIFDAAFYCPTPSYPLSITMSILSLSHKYEVPFLIVRTVRHLETQFPLDQKMLDALSRPSGNEDAVLVHSESDQNRGTIGEYLDMLPILDYVGIGWIIPGGLYVLVKWYEIEEIMEHPSFGQLGSKYQVLVVKFDRNRAIANHSRNSWTGILPAKDCHSQSACGSFSRSIQADEYWILSYDLAPKSTLCRHCQESAEKYERKLKDIFWNQCFVLCDFKNSQGATQMRKRAMKDFEEGVTKMHEFRFV